MVWNIKHPNDWIAVRTVQDSKPMTEKPNSVCTCGFLRGSSAAGSRPCPVHRPVAEPAEPSASQKCACPPNCHCGDCSCHLSAPQPVPGLDPRPDLDWPVDAIRKNQPAQPVAGHLEIMADAAKEAVRMETAAADKYMRYAQPVAGEGPQCVGCSHKLPWLSDARWGSNPKHTGTSLGDDIIRGKCPYCNTPNPTHEGTPKLEEIALQVTRYVRGTLVKPLHVAEEEDYLLKDIAAILCPFITPACTPERVIEMRLCETERLVLKSDQFYRFSVDPNCKRCKEMDLATPASTGEANGPELTAIQQGWRSFSLLSAQCFLVDCRNCDRENCDHYCHKAPTSVPQAEPPKKESK